jgi:hypothetical protein
LLDNDRKTNNETTAIARQLTANNNRRMVFSALSDEQQLNINRGKVFSVQSVPRCYKQGKSRVEFSSVIGME